MSYTPIILPYNGVKPDIHPDAYVAPGAVVIGNVTIGKDSNIWFNCVLRGDVNHITIGERTNIQDGTVVHVTRKTHPTVIGSDITVGHKALLHGCTLEDGCFFGMGATAMDGAVVGEGAMLAAGALLTPNKRIPEGQLWAGNPAKYFRDLKAEEKAFFPESIKNYVELSKEYMNS